MSNNPPEDQAPGARIGATVIGALVLAVVLAIIAWGLAGFGANATTDQLETAVAPWNAARRIAAPITSGRAFEYFNIPLKAMLVHALWLLTVWNVGALVVRRANRSEMPLSERFVLQAACGLVIVGLFVLLLGLIYLPGAPFFWTLLILGTCGVFFRRRELCETRIACGKVMGSVRGFTGYLIATIAGLLAVALYLYALTPPIQSDAMRYHLAAPQEFLRLGRIAFLPLNAFSNFPFLPEMHFTVALACGTPEASQLMHFTAFVLCVVAVYAFCRQTGLNRAPSCYASLTYAVAPVSLILSAWPFIDHFVALFFFLAFSSGLQAIRRPDLRNATIAGLMWGGAVGVKYTAAVYLPILLIVLGFELALRKRRGEKIVGKALLLFLIVAAASGGVWLLKNVVYTRNPVYPMAYGIFGGGDWSQANAQAYAAKAAEKGISKTLVNLFVAPIHATFHWPLFEGQHVHAVFLGLLISAIGAMVWKCHRLATQPRYVLYSTLVALAFYVTWFFSYQGNRLLLPMFLLLVPGAACLLQQVWPFALARRVLAAAFFLAWAHSGIWTLQFIYAVNRNNTEHLLGAISREQFLSSSLNYYRGFQRMQHSIKPGERILLIGEHRIFYATFPAVWSDWYDTPAVVHLMRKHRAKNAGELEAALKQERIVAVLINEAELAPQLQTYFHPRFTESEWKILQEFLNAHAAQSTLIPPGMRLIRVK